MKRADYTCSALCAGLLLACCTGCLTQPATSAPAKQSGSDELVTVKTLSPQKTSLRRTTTQPATVRAFYQAEIYAQVAGYLDELSADIGQQVDLDTELGTIAVPELHKSRQRQEATIRRLEAEEKRAAAEITVAQANAESAAALLKQAEAERRSAEAQLSADKIEHERVRDLVQNKALAKRLGDEAFERFESAKAAKAAAEAAADSADANVDVADAKTEAARADVAIAQAATEVASSELEELVERIAYATLRSPFKGIVTQRSADPGDLIRNAPTSSPRDSPPLFVIAQLDKVRVCVQVPERDAPWANHGDPATLTFQALPGQSFPGTVSRVAGCLDESTRTMTVEIDLDNPAHKLLPGMFGQATILLEEHDSLVLPASAVRYDETGRSYVYVIDPDDRVQVVDVTVGLDDGLVIEITAGLTGTERVVDAMLGRLKPGQKVRVQDQ